MATLETSQPKTLIAGVGHRFWRDRSAGPEFCDRLGRLEWPPHVTVADYSFGAIPMMYQLQDDRYQRALFIASEVRGREPGTLHPYRADPELPQTVDVFQEYMNEAGSGVIAIELLLVIAKQFGALPPQSWVLEIEPVEENGPEGLTPGVQGLYPKVEQIVRAFVKGELPAELAAEQAKFGLHRPFAHSTGLRRERSVERSGQAPRKMEVD
jgi:hydrogenase maturation protease